VPAEFSRPKSRRPPVFVNEIVTSFVPVDEVNAAFVRACVLVNAPLALNVVNAPVDAVVAPMAVEFRPVEVSVATLVLLLKNSTLRLLAVPKIRA